eukprot:6285554-Amphidinium_carterae.1
MSATESYSGARDVPMSLFVIATTALESLLIKSLTNSVPGVDSQLKRRTKLALMSPDTVRN